MFVLLAECEWSFNFLLQSTTRDMRIQIEEFNTQTTIVLLAERRIILWSNQFIAAKTFAMREAGCLGVEFVTVLCLYGMNVEP